jgi:hypothetical protein
VGYGEVRELSTSGRSFAIFFILLGFMIVAIAFRFIVEHLALGWSVKSWKQKKIEE